MHPIRLHTFLPFVIPLFALFFFSLCCFPVYSQKLSTKSNTSFDQDLLKVASLFESGKNDAALNLINQLITQSRESKNSYQEAIALIQANDILIEIDDLSTAAGYAERTEKIGLQIKDTVLYQISLLHKGQVKLFSDEVDQSISYFEQCIAHLHASFPETYRGILLNDLGYAWGQKNDLGKQADYTLQSLKVYQAINDDLGQATALGNLSTVFYALGQKDKAIEYGLQSLQFREQVADLNKLALCCCNLSQYYLGVDSSEASSYMIRCLDYANQLAEPQRLIQSYITASLVANNQTNNGLAFEYEKKAISLLENSESNNTMLARRYIAAAFYSDLLKMDSSITNAYFNKSIALSRSLNNRINLRDVYKYQSDYFAKRGDSTRAFKSYLQHILYKDSITKAEREEFVATLERQYQTEKKDNEILRLNTEQQLRKLEIEGQRAIIAENKVDSIQKEASILALYNEQVLKDATIDQQQEDIIKQQLISRNQQQALTLAQRDREIGIQEITAQKWWRNMLIASILVGGLLIGLLFNRYQLKRKLEKEREMVELRNSIARDLHDEIGSALSGIKILSEVSKSNVSKDQQKAESYLSIITEQSIAMQQGMSDIVWALKSGDEKASEVIARMRDFASQILEPKEIKTKFIVDAAVEHMKVNMRFRRDVFLIFREGINNIVKHADCTQVTIHLAMKEHCFNMIIEDDGKGFDLETTTGNNGLKNMVVRAQQIGGICNIHSQPGIGTTISVQVPAT